MGWEETDSISRLEKPQSLIAKVVGLEILQPHLKSLYHVHNVIKSPLLLYSLPISIPGCFHLHVLSTQFQRPSDSGFMNSNLDPNSGPTEFKKKISSFFFFF